MTDQRSRYLCIHGHFYQPPRENPWLEAVEVQDSAAPFHDWNERITRECYGPNSVARLVDAQGTIIHLLNNYAWMSFNFGPTLLAWLDGAMPDVLRSIVEADRLARERRNGHGNALAQVYNHVIMPLASPADKRTQVLWGIADFKRRFGHKPEGMWLAETAADVASLEALAEAGIRFTVLAPNQARRWRKKGETKWSEGPGAIDPSRAYRCILPSGKAIALFFYDGAISQAVAFEKLLDSGEKFLDRLMQGFDSSRSHPQLVHIATDGESYGHHHQHGDMALAFVLDRLRQHPEIRLTNYGEYLELCPPEWEVEIHENSSWSCAHGVERWRSNCGCNTGRGWQQEWRGPLRQALDWLKSQLDELFTRRGARCFPNPWHAREAYIQVILDRNPENVRRFLKEHAHPGLDDALDCEALWLLEMQRHGMLMYTSCGWFFDEISGLETTQCLRYAARAIQLARHFQADFEEEFVKALEKAPSNLKEFENGRGVWEKLIRPEKIDLDRVLAHYAISLIYREAQEEAAVYCYDVRMQDHQLRSHGVSHLAMGRLLVRSHLTWNEAETSFLVIHFGGLDCHAVLRKARPPDEYKAFERKMIHLYESGSLADVTELAKREFEGETYRLKDLFIEEQRRIVGIALGDRITEYWQAFSRLAEKDEDVLHSLGQMHYPIPRPMREAATGSFDLRLRQELELENGERLARIKQLLDRGKTWGFQPDRELLGRELANQLRSVMARIGPGSDLPKLTSQVGQLLEVAALLGISLDLWQAQNKLLDAFAIVQKESTASPSLREAFVEAAKRMGISPDLLGWRP